MRHDETKCRKYTYLFDNVLVGIPNLFAAWLCGMFKNGVMSMYRAAPVSPPAEPCCSQRKTTTMLVSDTFMEWWRGK
jgi:hypothetical protein